MSLEKMTGVDNIVERGLTFRKMLLPLILFAAWSSMIKAFPNGAPESACSTLTPVHPRVQAQNTSSPYQISVENTGNKYTVNILSRIGEDISGFLLQARSLKDKSKVIDGKFSQQDGVSRAIDCFDGKENTLTHTDPGSKPMVKTEWVPSVDLDEDVIFRATVAKTFTLFWTEVDSFPIRVTSKGSQSASPAHSPQEDSSSMYSNCFTTEGCFGLPRGCVDSKSCKIFLSYKHEGTGVSFTLKGLLQTNAYMSMALSHDNKMGDDFVTACTPTRAQESYNEGHTNTASRQLSTGYHISYRNGLASCSWTTKYLAEAPNGDIFDLGSNKYHLLLAKGLFKEKSEKLDYHHGEKIASALPVNFTTFELESTSSQDFSDSTQVYGVSESSFTEVTKKNSVSISTTEKSIKKSVANCHFLSKILFTLVITGLLALLIL